MFKRTFINKAGQLPAEQPVRTMDIGPALSETLEQNVKPVLNGAQQIAATTSVLPPPTTS